MYKICTPIFNLYFHSICLILLLMKIILTQRLPFLKMLNIKMANNPCMNAKTGMHRIQGKYRQIYLWPCHPYNFFCLDYVHKIPDI